MRRPLPAVPLLIAGLSACLTAAPAAWGLHRELGKAGKKVGDAVAEVPENLFVEVCAAVYRDMSEKIKGTGTPSPLTPKERKLLGREFGLSFVDRVQVRYGAAMQVIRIAGRNLTVDAAAQTFGRVVYVKDRKRPDNDWQLSMLAHEFVHVGQYDQGDFFNRYCRDVFKAGFKYEDVALEVEAFRLQRLFERKNGLAR